MALLDEILKEKQAEVEKLKVNGERKKGFKRIRNSFKNGETNIIAEIKQVSPSAGFIRRIDLDSVLDVYNRYAKGISVLTDSKFFGGSFEFLKKVTERTELPVLCKEFIIDKRQIDMAYVCGADMVLLITRILDEEVFEELYRYALGLGLDVLVEVHTDKGLERAKRVEPDILGVNSRDLDTLEISLERAKGILESVDFECVRIAESGIRIRKDVKFLKDVCDGFLVGEALLKGDIEEKFKELLL